jgi:hypothetical protein
MCLIFLFTLTPAHTRQRVPTIVRNLHSQIDLSISALDPLAPSTLEKSGFNTWRVTAGTQSSLYMYLLS